VAAEKTGKKTGTVRSPINGAEMPSGAHAGNSGGKKGRSGRRPSEVTKLAQQLAEKHDLLGRLARIAVGEEQVPYGMNEDGELVCGAPRAADQIAAARVVLSYAYGRPPEHLVVSGEVTRYVVTAPKFPSSVAEWRKLFTPSRS